MDFDAKNEIHITVQLSFQQYRTVTTVHGDNQRDDFATLQSP